MVLFLTWVGILSFALGAIFIYLLKSKRIGFKFQSRVSIWFLLISLIPTVPLILLSAALINNSLNLLFTGSIASTFDDSLDVIRSQLVARNSEIVRRISSNMGTNTLWGEWEEVHYIYRLNLRDDAVIADTLFVIESEGAPVLAPVNIDRFIEIKQAQLRDVLNTEKKLLESYRMLPDSTILQVGVAVDPGIVATIENIVSQSGSSFFRFTLSDNITNENIIYIIGIILVFLITVIALAIGSNISRGITKPIRSLVTGFKQVGEGNLDVQVDAKAKDEIAYLINSFNAMTGDLKNTQNKLLQSERIAAWRDVARQISHEIKNPLTPIQLSLHRLKNKIRIPKENSAIVEESFETINEEIESLRKIATEFSEFARMPKPNLTNVNINDIIRSTIVLYENNKQEIGIRAELDEDIPESVFDPEQIKRVLINLLTNSIDACTKTKGNIVISSSCSKVVDSSQRIIVKIEDTGEGMDKETLQKIFDPYYTTKGHGTGLGMPIIKRIVDDHDGEIEVQSEPGKGTTVYLKFKLLSSEENSSAG